MNVKKIAHNYYRKLTHAVAAALLAFTLPHNLAFSAPEAVATSNTTTTSVWLEDYDEAMKQAKDAGRAVFVLFEGSDWCQYCQKLDEEVLSQPAFVNYAKDNLVLLRLDFPQAKQQSDALKAQNEKLAAQFQIEGYPTIILLTAEGKELARLGYAPGGVEQYVEYLKTFRVSTK